MGTSPLDPVASRLIPDPKRHQFGRGRAVVTIWWVIGTLVGCSGDGSADGAASTTIAVARAPGSETIAAAPTTSGLPYTLASTTTVAGGSATTADPVTTATDTTATDTTATDTTAGGLNPLGGDDPEDKLMPDVICRGLQAAQDEIQDHGVFFSKSKDATGKGRRQIWDRNWIVVDQDPAPGTPIGEGEAVLYVVKTNEDHDC